MAAAGFARMVLLKKKRVRKEEGKQDYLGRNKGAGRGRSHGREESKKGKGFLFI
jgi:hypothetical protein